MEEAEKDQVEFVEAREDATKAFEPAEQALNFVAPAVHGFIVLPGLQENGQVSYDQAAVQRGRQHLIGQHLTNHRVASQTHQQVAAATSGCGVVYKLTPSGSGWTETLLYSFVGNEGEQPIGGVVFGRSGNLYGVFEQGGPAGRGAVYQLSPSGGSWTEQTLQGVDGRDDGAYPVGGLIIDSSGNLYGTTSCCGYGGGGTAFELMPGSGGGWTFNTLYRLPGNGVGLGPVDKLLMDGAGNLYGTSYQGGDIYGGRGAVFKLSFSNGRWWYTSLHDFSGPPNDGAEPHSNLVFDASGNLWGTTTRGGQHDAGVVFEITQPF